MPMQIPGAAIYSGGKVKIAQVDANNFTVQLPLKAAPSPRCVAEINIKKEPVTSMRWMNQMTAKDLRGILPTVIMSPTIGANESTNEYARRIGLHSDTYPTGFDFYGMGHRNELRLPSPQFILDGNDIGELGEGEGYEFEIIQQATILMPAGASATTPVGLTTCRHTFSGNGISVWHRHRLNSSAGLVIDGRNVYDSMLAINNTNCNRVQMGAAAAVALTHPGSPSTIISNNTDIYFTAFHTNPNVNPYAIRMILGYGQPDLITPFSSVTAVQNFCVDQATNAKVYIQGLGDTQSTITLDTDIDCLQHYDLFVGNPSLILPY